MAMKMSKKMKKFRDRININIPVVMAVMQAYATPQNEKVCVFTDSDVEDLYFENKANIEAESIIMAEIDGMMDEAGIKNADARFQAEGFAHCEIMLEKVILKLEELL